MFEVLIYLFENYLEGGASLALNPDTIVTELEQAGFSRNEIGRALDWLHGLNRMQEVATNATTHHAIRHYTPQEMDHLGLETQGLLLYLEQLSILDPKTREMVIDRLMALDRFELSPNRVKWVVLIALFSQPDKKSALSLLQDMILSDAFDILH